MSLRNITFILHKPQLSENIGACARALKNFSFNNLSIVNPKSSFPNDKIRTQRYVSIVVEADNHEGQLSFSASSENIKDAFECVCVQHEIDHLNGITMFDREFKQVPIKREGKKIGRNEKVTITKGSESKVLKYKKAQPMLEDGWTLSIS